jgi:modulator of FtsH protease HflC
MSVFRNIFALIAAAVLAVAYMAYFVVDEREKVLVSRFGEISRIVEEPGLYFKMPFADTVTSIEDRIIVWENNDSQVQDRASQVYIVDAITLARIADARKFRETLGANLEEGETRVGALLDAALRQTYGRRSFDEALSAERIEMMREIRDQVRREAEPLGIQIVDVRIRRTDLSPQVLQQTYARMVSERNALAADIRSRGEATKTRMDAETNRMFTEKTAAARRQSEIIRGEADAERNQVFAQAFEQDPEFFRFYRSMQAYTKALASGDTTLVLNPQSDFFKYFGSQVDGSSPQQPAQPTTP